jgi:drug/metabolite transporter (DMT)-like permease
VLFGVVLISGVGGGAYGQDPVLGVVLGLATAFCYAAYLLIIRRGGRDVRRPAGPVAIATASTTAVAALAGVVVGDLDPTPGPGSLLWLVAYGVTSQSLGYLLISLSLPRLPAVVTSIILLAQPVVTVLLAMVLLGEAPSAGQLAGVALVIGGIAVATVPVATVRDTVRARATGS